MDAFLEAPIFIAGLPLLIGVRKCALMTIPYFAETAQSCMIDTTTVTGGRLADMEKNEVPVDFLGKVKNSFARSKYICDDEEVHKCTLKCSKDFCELLPPLDAVPYLQSSVK